MPAELALEPGVVPVVSPPEIDRLRAVIVHFGIIPRIFFGGEGHYANYDQAKESIAQRKEGYRRQGYVGPMPWRMMDAQTAAFIEEGS